MKNIFKLVIAIGVAEVAGFIGTFFTAPAIQSRWYASLAKPQLSPPNWVFGPVWTTLFALMGVALWLVWIDRSAAPKARRRAVAIFFVQLALNALWSMIFFGFRSPGGATVEIILLWLAILATMVTLAKISKPAAWLLVPYILWVSFAVYLNFSIWMLN
jgi:tryptophan-rich sensory protein